MPPVTGVAQEQHRERDFAPRHTGFTLRSPPAATGECQRVTTRRRRAPQRPCRRATELCHPHEIAWTRGLAPTLKNDDFTMALSSYLATLLLTSTVGAAPAATPSPIDRFEWVLTETRAATRTETRFVLPGSGHAEATWSCGKLTRTCTINTDLTPGRDQYKVELECHSEGGEPRGDLKLRVAPRKPLKDRTTVARVTTPDGATVELAVVPQ